MRKYKVEFIQGATEEVVAHNIKHVGSDGSWIEFSDGQHQVVKLIRTGDVRRIDVAA